VCVAGTSATGAAASLAGAVASVAGSVGAIVGAGSGAMGAAAIGAAAGAVIVDAGAGGGGIGTNDDISTGVPGSDRPGSTFAAIAIPTPPATSIDTINGHVRLRTGAIGRFIGFAATGAGGGTQPGCGSSMRGAPELGRNRATSAGSVRSRRVCVSRIKSLTALDSVDMVGPLVEDCTMHATVGAVLSLSYARRSGVLSHRRVRKPPQWTRFAQL
jgi:hypothetical protein